MVTVVIDTNILIGASHDEFSFSKRIIDAVIAGELKAVASHQTLSENKLLLEKAVKDEKYKALLNDFFGQIELVRVTKRVSISDDPDDNKFIEVALEAGANYIISSDAHLLDIGEFKGIKILNSKDFWYEYSGEQKDEATEWQDWMKNIMGDDKNL